jgi:hypothetical protein
MDYFSVNNGPSHGLKALRERLKKIKDEMHSLRLAWDEKQKSSDLK